MDVLRDRLMAALGEVFGEHVRGYTVSEMRDEPTPWLTLKFALYEYFPVTFEYDRGRFGFSIEYARPVRVQIPQHTSHDIDEPSEVIETVQALRDAVRLRIPPAYLESIGA